MKRREKQLQKDIESFLETKLDPFNPYNKSWFKRVFEPFKLKDNIYLLDSLSNEQRKMFIEYYQGWCGGGGEYDFGFNLPRKYRIELRLIFDSFILIEKSYEDYYKI